MNFSQNRPKVYFKTFGCRTNVFDTQVMMSNLKDFEVTLDENEANIVVINSCTVTNSADSTARTYINSLKKLPQNPRVIFLDVEFGQKVKLFLKRIKLIHYLGIHKKRISMIYF